MPSATTEEGNGATRGVPPTSGSSDSQPSTSSIRDLFALPPPVKRLFDRFPLVTYQPLDLPLRSPKIRHRPILYVFSTADDARRGRPSFNPSCLKWQTYLKFGGIDFQLCSSNNHASPSGALPFLIPFTAEQQSTPLPVPASKLEKYARSRGSKVADPPTMRYEAYLSLLDHRIRQAWLYFLYLESRNSPVLDRMYVEQCSSNPIVRLAIRHQLRTAADANLCKFHTIVNPSSLYADADQAFDALSVLLGDDTWFFGTDKPSLFDASVFAYTHLLLDKRLGWQEQKLVDAVRARPNLSRHRQHILVEFYSMSADILGKRR